MVVKASPHKQEIVDAEKKKTEKVGKKRVKNLKKNTTGSNKKRTKKNDVKITLLARTLLMKTQF